MNTAIYSATYKVEEPPKDGKARFEDGYADAWDRAEMHTIGSLRTHGFKAAGLTASGTAVETEGYIFSVCFHASPDNHDLVRDAISKGCRNEGLDLLTLVRIGPEDMEHVISICRNQDG